MGCRLWLDDRRKPPWSYDLWAKDVAEAIRMLQEHEVEHCSLDHDLVPEHYKDAGEDIIDRSKYKVPTGYAVLEWMHDNNHWVADISVHTLNPQGGEDMLLKLQEHAPPNVEFRRVLPWEV